MNTEREPDHAQVAFRPPILLLVAMVAAWGADRLLPARFLPDAFATAGAGIGVLALALFAWAALTMRTAGGSIPTSTPTERLVVKGPYRFSRNPIYLAMLLLLLGLGLRKNNAWFLAFAVVCFALFSWGVVAREERYLGRKLGAEYAEYRRRVRRWI